jgi:hypothetical protein
MINVDPPSGKVPMWPPCGTKEPTYFLERHVLEKLQQGWTLEYRVVKKEEADNGTLYG